MVTIELFQHAERRRYFVVERQEQIQAFAVCVPIYGRNGWLLEDMMVLPSAPSGASELLIDTVMRQLSQEGADVVSLGMVALAGLDGGKEKEKHPLLTFLLRTSARTMGWLYHFEGLYRFRNKIEAFRMGASLRRCEREGILLDDPCHLDGLRSGMGAKIWSTGCRSLDRPMQASFPFTRDGHWPEEALDRSTNCSPRGWFASNELPCSDRKLCRLALLVERSVVRMHREFCGIHSHPRSGTRQRFPLAPFE